MRVERLGGYPMTTLLFLNFSVKGAVSQFVGIGLKSLGMPFNRKDNGLVLNALAFVAWRFCREHY